MTEWIKYDGTNPPTDTTKHVIWEWIVSSHVHPHYTTTWLAGWARDKRVPDNFRRYAYIDPYKEPLPKCWCGASVKIGADSTGYGVSCRDRHGIFGFPTEAEARENWRKLRA